MKKFFLLVISFALITSFSSAQTLEKFTARDAYEYVKQQGTLDNKEAISIIAIGMANEMVSMNVDFASGKADNWTIVTRSKDIQDTTMYFYTITKVAGMMIATEETDIETNAQETVAISTENWMNSDKVVTYLPEDGVFHNYLKANEGTLEMSVMTFSNMGVGELWAVMASVNQEQGDMAVCSLDGYTGELIQCEAPNAVQNQPTFIPFSIYPNPTSGVVNLESPAMNSANVEIYDINGSLVNTSKMELNEKSQIDLSAYSNGIYTIIIRGDKQNIIRKVILTK